MGRKSNKEATAKKMKWQESFTHLTNPALFSFELLAVSKFAYYIIVVASNMMATITGPLQL